MIPDPGAGDPGRDARLAAGYRAGAQQQPPERLDDAIRAAARRAVAAGPRRGTDRLRRWSIPLSLAAVVVLSVTLVTMMREEGADRWVSDAPPLPRAQPPGAVVDVPAQPATEAMAPAPPPARQTASPVAERPQSAPRAEPPAPELRGQEHREKQAADDGSRKATADAAALADATAGVRQDSALRDAAAPRALLRSAPVSAPAALAETATANAAQSAAGSPGLGAVPSAQALPPRSTGTLWQDLEGEPAAKWLDRLRELRKAGRVADAERLVAEFRRRFPDAALPDDLR